MMSWQSGRGLCWGLWGLTEHRQMGSRALGCRWARLLENNVQSRKAGREVEEQYEATSEIKACAKILGGDAKFASVNDMKNICSPACSKLTVSVFRDFSYVTKWSSYFCRYQAANALTAVTVLQRSGVHVSDQMEGAYISTAVLLLTDWVLFLLWAF